MKEPFTKEEKEIMDLLEQAYEKFIELERTHPHEMQEYVYAYHQLQNLVCFRILRRDYPDTFFTGKEK